jgi:hypothetical protein
MENLVIKGEKNTFYTPTVVFSAETGVCELKGESYLENTFEFYKQLENWMKKFSSSRKPITLNIALTYFNTSSSRSILDLLLILKEYEKSGGKVDVTWKLEDWDDDMKAEVEDFISDSGLSIVTNH